MASWQSGLYDCCNDCNICCYGCWCQACLYGKNAVKIDGSDYDEACWIYCSSGRNPFAIPQIIDNRTALRAKYGLAEEPCDDSLVILCCAPCSVCQAARELKSRDNMPDQLVQVATPAIQSVETAASTYVPFGLGIYAATTLVQTGTFIFMAKKLANLSDAVVTFLPYAEAATYPSIWKSFQHVLRFQLKRYDHVLVVVNDHYAALAFSGWMIGTELEGRVGFIDDLRHVTVDAPKNSSALLLFFCVDKWDIDVFHVTCSNLCTSSRHHLEGLSMNHNKLKINKLILDLPDKFLLDFTQEQQPLKVSSLKIDTLQCSQLDKEILNHINQNDIRLYRHNYIKQAATIVTERILDQDKAVQLPDYYLDEHKIDDYLNYFKNQKDESKIAT